jgi:uncharacterized surface protein with fasciclin (FAS1) repeats
MKSSLKFLASFVGVAGLSLSISLPSVAQTTPSRGGMTPGSMSPGMMNSPNGMQGSSTYQSTVSVPTSAEPMSIDAIVDASPSFEMLNALIRVAAIEEPQLVRALAGGSNLTVFAPTDEAFAALPPEAIRALVQPENRDLLIRILSNHVVPGMVSSAEIASADLGLNLDMGLTPPSGEMRPNENVGAVREENLAPNAGGNSMGSAGMNDGRQASAPPSGEMRPNENTGNVIREELAPNADSPNRTRDQMEVSQRPQMSSPGGMSTLPQMEAPGRPEVMPQMSSPGGMSSGGMSGDMSAMDMGTSENQSMEPPSGEMRPNENVGNVREETLAPNASRQGMNMGGNMGRMGGNMGSMANMSGMGNMSMVSAARVIAPDIQASNGIIHAINRVILSPELQSEVQQAIANLDN